MESKDSVQKRNSLVWGGAKETKVDGTVCKMLQKKRESTASPPKGGSCDSQRGPVANFTAAISSCTHIKS